MNKLISFQVAALSSTLMSVSLLTDDGLIAVVVPDDSSKNVNALPLVECNAEGTHSLLVQLANDYPEMEMVDGQLVSDTIINHNGNGAVLVEGKWYEMTTETLLEVYADGVTTIRGAKFYTEVYHAAVEFIRTGDKANLNVLGNLRKDLRAYVTKDAIDIVDAYELTPLNIK
jgi:hypothetical protein